MNYFTEEENLEEIIRKKFEGKEIIRIEKNRTGWTNIVYKVETAEENYYFRFPRDDFWSKTIVKDYEFAKFIKNKTSFKTCELILEEDAKGRKFSIHREIEGTPLAEVMNDLTDEEIKNISAGISKFMYELHGLDSNKEIFKMQKWNENLYDFVNELLEEHVSDKDMKFWKSTNFLELPSNSLVHGDFNSSNVLLDKNKKFYAVIDFGFGGYGNKYHDISRIIGRLPNNFKEHIVAKYEELSKNNLDKNILEKNIDIWTKIDNGYINYMRNKKTI